MDNWIAQRIRAVSVRRVLAWTLALAVRVLLATSDHRYIANFLHGPYALAPPQLLSLLYGERFVPAPRVCRPHHRAAVPTGVRLAGRPGLARHTRSRAPSAGGADRGVG